MPGSIFLQNVDGAVSDFLKKPADAQALATMMSAANMFHNGATFDMARIPTVFKAISAVTITAATGSTVWDPASGKKFRLLGFALSASAATSFKFYEGLTTALTTLILQTPIVAAAGVIVCGWPMLGNGIRASAVDMNLNLDVSGTTPAVSGWVCGVEE